MPETTPAQLNAALVQLQEMENQLAVFRQQVKDMRQAVQNMQSACRPHMPWNVWIRHQFRLMLGLIPQLGKLFARTCTIEPHGDLRDPVPVENAQDGCKRFGKRCVATDVKRRHSREVRVVPALKPPIDVDVGPTPIERPGFQRLESACGFFVVNATWLID